MLRNKEIRRFTLVFAAITAGALGAGFAINPSAGLVILAFATALGGAFGCFTRTRYRRLAALADQIDEVLHYDDALVLTEMEEGELSILKCEIAKMTQRIQEQNMALKKEKAHLAESLADIAHQLRTPLTSANLILSLLKQDPEAPQRRTLLRESEALFAQMDWLITSLLKLSRLDAGIVSFQSVSIDLPGLIHTALTPLRIPMELHDITLKLHLPQGAQLLGDAAWLSEALGNLLKNGMNSAGDHGTLTITGEDTPLFTTITIHDSGPGFKPGEIPHLFDRFYQGEAENPTGYGIGLALCHSIITRQGGRIIAKNHPQGGALFILHFPKPTIP
ncbi:Signal transduction histidine kinase [Eubacterium aggregans]|uniref:histidine kinase n=1 Tax=Eubacterium aggregans TaxID=81409 RepID=A0A1H4CF87_9FIRM|nr:HAMP domain-containing sensor histidine kinase [Eubacterium aggregans]SEA59071.1 Signal transduction histidine kinase [Eubacterium aggregans]